MKDIIALNQELSSFGISLHKRTVEVLIGEIEQAIAGGLIRSKDDQYSIFDFIRVLLGDKAERKTWKRFVETDSNTVAFCHSVKFDRKDGKLANTESPATSLFGLVYIAYMATGDYSQQLRRSSALYFVESRKAQNVVSVVAETESKKIAELTDLLKDWETKYKQVYDRMQYHQARAMGNDMLVRLKEKPEAFSEDSELLWLISGIASKSYFVGRCREDLKYGVDYINGARKGTLKLTPYAALQMLLNFRSKKGVQARYLPETVEVTVKKSIGSDGSKINRRKMQQS
jgi:hypothetical protein